MYADLPIRNRSPKVMGIYGNAFIQRETLVRKINAGNDDVWSVKVGPSVEMRLPYVVDLDDFEECYGEFNLTVDGVKVIRTPRSQMHNLGGVGEKVVLTFLLPKKHLLLVGHKSSSIYCPTDPPRASKDQHVENEILGKAEIQSALDSLHVPVVKVKRAGWFWLTYGGWHYLSDSKLHITPGKQLLIRHQ